MKYTTLIQDHKNICSSLLHLIFAGNSVFTRAEASSILYNIPASWGPSLAIDGVISNISDGYFHSRTETDPWLKVTARETIHVLSVIVSHRNDCCMERFQNARVILIGVYGNEVQCGNVFAGGLTSRDRETTFECGSAIPAISIKIVVEGHGMVLQVNEIIVTIGEPK